MTVEERLKILEDIVFARYANTIKARQIFIVDTCQAITAREFDLQKEIITSRQKRESYTWPRHVAMFLAYELTGMGQTPLAKLFNRDDHGTIFYAISRVRHEISRRTETGKERALQLTVIRQRIKEEINKVWPEKNLITPIPTS